MSGLAPADERESRPVDSKGRAAQVITESISIFDFMWRMGNKAGSVQNWLLLTRRLNSLRQEA